MKSVVDYISERVPDNHAVYRSNKPYHHAVVVRKGNKPLNGDTIQRLVFDNGIDISRCRVFLLCKDIR